MKNHKLAIHPVTLLFLGTASALGASTDLRAALAMSAAVLCVLLLSALLLGLLKKLIPTGARLPAALLTVAGLSGMVQMLLQALLPGATAMLGIYAAILAVELLLFGGAENAMDRGLGRGLLDALCCGLCFALFLLVLAAIREIFGAASVAGHSIEWLKNYKIPLLTQSAGGLIVFSVLLAVVNRVFPPRAEEGGLCLSAAGLKAAEQEGEV